MTEYIEVSKEAARRFLVYRQAFLKYKGKEGTLEAVRGLVCVGVRILPSNPKIPVFMIAHSSFFLDECAKSLSLPSRIPR